MLIPRYWAEDRQRHKERDRQITVRRLGWSNLSQDEAQAHARSRATEALQRLINREQIPRFESSHGYNGAEGIPIREEIVDQFEATIVTRNSYGALCLNTPNVLIADVDTPSISCTLLLLVFGLLVTAGVMATWQVGTSFAWVAVVIGSLMATLPVTGAVERVMLRLRGGHAAIHRRRVGRFLARHPDWNVRLYQTPAGFRVIATHRTFDPSEQMVQDFFQAVRADRVYVRMCNRQQCFRARVSPKPWRIGVAEHISPRGRWRELTESEGLRRTRWIANYNDLATGYSACQFMGELGSGVCSPDVRSTIDDHDRLSGADSGRPMA